jgi:hypothetical protein
MRKGRPVSRRVYDVTGRRRGRRPKMKCESLASWQDRKELAPVGQPLAVLPMRRPKAGGAAAGFRILSTAG